MCIYIYIYIYIGIYLVQWMIWSPEEPCQAAGLWVAPSGRSARAY